MILKTWFIEEIMLDGSSDAGGIGQRQTMMEFNSETGEWVRPDGRLNDEKAINLWDKIVKEMKQDNDLTYIINPVSLMDYCNDYSLYRDNRKRGSGDKIIEKSIVIGGGSSGSADVS